MNCFRFAAETLTPLRYMIMLPGARKHRNRVKMTPNNQATTELAVENNDHVFIGLRYEAAKMMIILNGSLFSLIICSFTQTKSLKDASC